MIDQPINRQSLHIGFVSTRFADTDGVSLETAKWAEVLEGMGHKCYYFSGYSDRPARRSMVVPEAYYRHPEIQERHDRFFAQSRRSGEDTLWIHHWRGNFRRHLYRFLHKFKIDALIPENVLAIPLNVPLGLALTEVIAETGIPTIAHHHDFAWERKRFLVNGIPDYINMAFPPDLPSISHVVINSQAQHQLARRRGVGSAIIPNVMNYEEAAPGIDDYSADLRERLGIAPDELFVLQPTRVVQRKGIEHAIELVRRLQRPAHLVISHASGDEGDEYEQRVREYAAMLGVPTIFCADIFDDVRGQTANGQKIYNLWDAYNHADLVTYPSVFEGFGNAFLEAIYFRKPIVVNNYSIYSTDIRPKGFRVIEFDEFVTDETVTQTRAVLEDPVLLAEMVERNYDLARHHFSYSLLRHKLRVQLENVFGANGGMNARPEGF
ncbi:MAG TPA: glycosyltransferase family 4 protein [Chloroflexota bacterium]|nr:glycosyltransferase family 4 protein [Chloroflexota bacterium]